MPFQEDLASIFDLKVQIKLKTAVRDEDVMSAVLVTVFRWCLTLLVFVVCLYVAESVLMALTV